MASYNPEAFLEPGPSYQELPQGRAIRSQTRGLRRPLEPQRGSKGNFSNILIFFQTTLNPTKTNQNPLKSGPGGGPGGPGGGP